MKFSFNTLKRRLGSKTSKSAMVAVIAKVAEKTVPNQTIWWIALGVGTVALFLIGFFAEDDHTNIEKSEEN